MSGLTRIVDGVCHDCNKSRNSLTIALWWSWWTKGSSRSKWDYTFTKVHDVLYRNYNLFISIQNIIDDLTSHRNSWLSIIILIIDSDYNNATRFIYKKSDIIQVTLRVVCLSTNSLVVAWWSWQKLRNIPMHALIYSISRSVYNKSLVMRR